LPAPQGRSNQAVPTCPRVPVPSCSRARVPPTPVVRLAPRALCALHPRRHSLFLPCSYLVLTLFLPCSYLVLTLFLLGRGRSHPRFLLVTGEKNSRVGVLDAFGDATFAGQHEGQWEPAWARQPAWARPIPGAQVASPELGKPNALPPRSLRDWWSTGTDRLASPQP
jgi:hypothetical protein